MNIIEAIHDKNLFGSLFRRISTWRAWIVALKVIFALPMDDEELTLYRHNAQGGKSLQRSLSAKFI